MNNLVKKHRIKNNITQRYLAEKINITISQLSNIENNRSIPSVEIALKLSKELNCNVEDIFKL